MSKILEKRIVPVMNPTENQKSVLAKIKAAATPKTAAADISTDTNLTAARDMLIKMGFITLDQEGAQVTPEGDQLMQDQGLTDEMGELTDEGRAHAGGVAQQPMEGYSLLRNMNEGLRREQYQHVPSDLLDKLTPEEENDLYNVLDGTSEFHNHDRLWSKVYSFFVKDMPYGTAKARTGDPESWVLNRLIDNVELGTNWWRGDKEDRVVFDD